MLWINKYEWFCQEKINKNTRDGRECDRIKAVLLSSEGLSTALISQALRKSQFTITRYLDDYHRKKEKLKPDNGGSESFLSEEQAEHLIEHLEQYTYAHVHQIAAYISDKWNIKYTVSGLNKWLHQQGSSYKKLF
ncbi:helix-turn-helix domain-containing protein [Parendozoicomonas callyspongiae]|uniref:helix-turn-helix domain-containing protein n=1 Tax=Parendozoicomonas callyspongiae TaxID=2942213 RepID=UPI0038CDB257